MYNLGQTLALLDAINTYLISSVLFLSLTVCLIAPLGDELRGIGGRIFSAKTFPECKVCMYSYQERSICQVT